MKLKNAGENYISPKEFTEQLKEYYDLSDAAEKFVETDESTEARLARRKAKKALDICGIAIYKLVCGLAANGSFSGYTWKDEMVGDALIKCNKALIGKKFKFERKYNPFSYYNMIAWHEFVHRIKVEKKKLETVAKFKSEHYYDIKDEDDTMYVKPMFMEDFGDFYNEENELKSQLEDD